MSPPLQFICRIPTAWWWNFGEVGYRVDPSDVISILGSLPFHSLCFCCSHLNVRIHKKTNAYKPEKGPFQDSVMWAVWTCTSCLKLWELSSVETIHSRVFCLSSLGSSAIHRHDQHISISILLNIHAVYFIYWFLSTLLTPSSLHSLPPPPPCPYCPFLLVFETTLEFTSHEKLKTSPNNRFNKCKAERPSWECRQWL